MRSSQLMLISYCYRHREAVYEAKVEQVVIGRAHPGAPPPDLDLSPDLTVSRPHARIWHDERGYWVEDLDSTHGTQVNGEEVKGHGRHRLYAGDSIIVGETTLHVTVPEAPGQRLATVFAPALAGGAAVQDEPHGRIAETVDASVAGTTVIAAATSDAALRLAMLYELLL